MSAGRALSRAPSRGVGGVASLHLSGVDLRGVRRARPRGVGWFAGRELRDRATVRGVRGRARGVDASNLASGPRGSSSLPRGALPGVGVGLGASPFARRSTGVLLGAELASQTRHASGGRGWFGLGGGAANPTDTPDASTATTSSAVADVADVASATSSSSARRSPIHRRSARWLPSPATVGGPPLRSCTSSSTSTSPTAWSGGTPSSPPP